MTTPVDRDPASPGQDRRRRLLATGGLIAALVAMSIFAATNIGALHKPTPHRVPIGVLDERTAAAVEATHGAFSAVRERNLVELRHDLRQRKIAAGLAGRTLFVASGASYTTAATVTAVFTKQVSGLQVVDVAPLQSGDSRGTSLFYLVLALGFGGYFAATVVSTLLGYGARSHRRAAERVAALAAFSVLAGLVGAAIADFAFGAIEGSFWALAGIGMLLSFAVAATTSALQSALGLAGTLVAMMLLIMLGNSSAGGPYQGTFTPEFWRSVGPYLPSGSGLSALKAAVYFDGANILGRLSVLIVYALAGALVIVVVGWRRGPRAPELELAYAAAV